MLTAALWLLVLEGLGLLALPLTFRLFSSLSDRGYAFSKTLGILLGAYSFWLLVTLDVLPNNAPALLLVLVFLTSALLLALAHDWRAIREFLTTERRTVLIIEAVFIGSFLLFTLFRSLAPDIHLTTALDITTEQPMDLAFLAATMRSPSYPPLDPWLSGYGISYYYMGYLALGWVGRLALSPPPVAYNLGLASIFALTATGAFGVAFNMARLSLDRDRASQRVALAAGFAGAAFVALWGNLVSVVDLLRAWGVVPGAVLSWLNIPGLTTPASQTSLVPSGGAWWWHASRVIVDPTPTDPIDEFPAWSFVLGDLHPHVMSLPFVLLAIGISLAFFARDGAAGWDWIRRHRWETFATALVLGALGFVNSWDFPIYLMLFGGVLLVQQLLREEGGVAARVFDVLVSLGIITVLAVALYSPFYFSFSSQVRGILPLAGTGTRPIHYLLLWGPFLALVAPFAVTLAYRHGGRLTRQALWTVVGISLAPLLLWTFAIVIVTLVVAAAPLERLADLLAEAQQRRVLYSPGELVGAVSQRWALVLPMIAAFFLAAVGALTVGRKEKGRGWAFGLILAAGAFLLIIGPELFFVVDLFGTRMNTVFKLHYQAWVLLGLSAAAGLAWLLTVRPPAHLYWRRARQAGLVVAAVVIIGGVVFPKLAPLARVATSPTGPTLDGFAYYRQRFPFEAEAIEWLAQHAKGGEVVVEAHGGDYSDFGRVAAMTGLPTILGWTGHELQWRGTFDPLAGREEDVEAIYSSADLGKLRDLLAQYDVTYVYVGRLERERYGPEAASALGSILPVAYQNRSVTIFYYPRDKRL